MNEHGRREQIRAIGARYRETRERKGLTARRVADLSGVHNSQVSRLESGARLPEALTIVRLCGVLDLSIGWLLTGNEAI